ncbi:MAG: hypothetical protein CFE32_10255 [Alphaproteobacteria bacterium PA3]|nr:MAG: hypothetical protein CFE32_10255 [Alphaproteobacteria bacterium PA3]
MNTIIKLSRADLSRKSRSQLAALFQQASLAVSVSQIDLNVAQSALAMIDQELARRGPAP